MAKYFPIILEGTNLQDRHRYFNLLVSQTYENNVPFHEIACEPEKSAIDRIFKIDLASKYRNVEYILKNLKDDDMLFVSRSLKCLWLLEPHSCDIINPLYLENILYPEMTQPAVNKMKHWIQLHLKDPERCQEFYNHYKTNFVEAFQYYWHCSNEFIMTEFPNVIDKFSPKQLKIVFEVCPAACRLYFEILPNNPAALAKYVKNACNYFNSARNILKSDGNLFLDIVEKHFNRISFAIFSPSATQYIMKHYRNRFEAKSELYTSSFLHMKTLAGSLTGDQAKELIMRLARAEYLDSWFSYKIVEPLIKRLKPEERSFLKKQVFVNKSIDNKVKEWPYPIPEPLKLEFETKAHIFTDIERTPLEYETSMNIRKKITKRCCKKLRCDNMVIGMGKSPLDLLFNRYRFIGFEQTLYELSKNLLAESSMEGRLHMMLVLVSKSGGNTDQVEKLLKLLVERHRNEPNTLRAAVLRSLVKRGCPWRLPENVWLLLLEFGKDVGLDGTQTDLLCREGLHAVVLRHLVTDKPLSPNLIESFLKAFSTLSEYKLNRDEIQLVAKRLPPLILSLSPNAFLDTLLQYKINIKDVIDAESTLLKAATGDPLLTSRLYKAKILRRELIHETFSLKKNNTTYVNSLRYETSLLKNGVSFATLVSEERPNHDRFLKSLSIYFSEPSGLAEQHRNFLLKTFFSNPKTWIPRCLCFLLSNEQLLNCLSDFESDKPPSKGQLLMSAGLRANAHKTKPPLNIDTLDYRWVGAKAVANKVLICRTNDRERYIKKLLEWSRTARISVRLSVTTPFAVDTFITFCSVRPLTALKVAISLYLKKDYVEPTIWNAVKPIIENTDISKKHQLKKKILYPCAIAKNIEADYWTQVYNTFVKFDKENTPVLCRLENILPNVDQTFISDVVRVFINNTLKPDKFSEKSNHDVDFSKRNCLCVRIIAKHLLLCKSEVVQEELMTNVCEPFFDGIELLLQTLEFKKHLIELLNDFIYSLKYSKVFLSKEYVSCMPVFEGILKRMRIILPVEENFGMYAKIHLTMLYYKTIRQTIKLKPEFLDDSKKRNEAIEIVGRIFGNYIGREINKLAAKYFKSIVDLYNLTLMKYLSNYFHFNETRHLLVAFIMKGLLEAGTIEASILTEHIFKAEQKYNIPEPHRAELLKALKESKDEEVKMFLYADVISVGCMIY